MGLKLKTNAEKATELGTQALLGKYQTWIQSPNKKFNVDCVLKKNMVEMLIILDIG